MKKTEIIKYLKSKYKTERLDGRTWRVILKDDEEGLLRVIPGKSGVPQQEQILGMPAMNLPWHQELEKSIFQDEKNFLHILFVGSEYHNYPDSGTIEEKDIDLMLEYCFTWFKQQSQPDVVAQAMAKYYEKPFGLPPPIWQKKHIISCVLKGDVEKLQSYLDAFKAGDRMEWIPLIQQEYFERAVPLAEKYRSGELISPVDF